MKSFREVLISPSTTIRETIERIDSGAVQIALIVDPSRRLLGTVTDGDVRRGILRGIGLEESVERIMNPDPITIDRKMGRGLALQLMRQWEIGQIPVVDDAERVIGLETIGALTRVPGAGSWVVLMAGGLGRRLRPLTDETPKPLLQVGGKPVLETIIEAFARQGFRRFFLSVNYKAEMFKAHFRNGAPWGVEIEYLEEDRRLGTAGALNLLPSPPAEPIIVMNGDVLTSVDFRHLLDFHQDHAADATMCVREYTFEVPYGVALLDNHRLTGISEKPRHKFFVNAGVYVLGAAALGLIPPERAFDMPDLFQEIIKTERSATVFPIREYWMDIGRFDDLERAKGEYLEVFG